MISKNKNIIPKSCQENWLELDSEEKIKFCNLCQKNVFDINSKTEEELTFCMRYPNDIKVKKNRIIDKITNLLIKKK
jgi:hypothetical protein